MLPALLGAPDVYVRVSSGTIWPTLILAIVGVVLSLGALAWQFYTVVFITGSRVTVTVTPGLRRPGMVITFKEDTDAAWIASYRAQGYTDPVIAVKVTNRGRGDTSIVGVSARIHPVGIEVKETLLEPPLPFPLKGEHSQSWYLSGDAIAGAVATSAKTWPKNAARLRVEARVELGSGKTVRSRNRLRG